MCVFGLESLNVVVKNKNFGPIFKKTRNILTSRKL